MKYWDSSALIPLVVDQPNRSRLVDLLVEDAGVVTWWATLVECTSAVSRLERDGALRPEEAATSLADLDRFAGSWKEIEATAATRRHALRLLRVHPLRAGDALQLAAALVACEGDPRTLPFVTLDDRLALAAQREGFPVTTFDLDS